MLGAPPLIATIASDYYRVHKKQSIVIRIPGGWQVRIARIEAESYLYSDLAAYYVACGESADRALVLARKAVQQMFVHGYTNGLRECVWRRACDYADMWPQHWRPTNETRKSLPVIELLGFNPERIVPLYVPMQKLGSKAAQHVKEILARMGEEAAA